MNLAFENLKGSHVRNFLGFRKLNSATGELELMFTNTEVHKIIHISKTNQDNPDL